MGDVDEACPTVTQRQGHMVRPPSSPLTLGPTGSFLEGQCCNCESGARFSPRGRVSQSGPAPSIQGRNGAEPELPQRGRAWSPPLGCRAASGPALPNGPAPLWRSEGPSEHTAIPVACVSADSKFS